MFTTLRTQFTNLLSSTTTSETAKNSRKRERSDDNSLLHSVKRRRANDQTTQSRWNISKLWEYVVGKKPKEMERKTYVRNQNKKITSTPAVSNRIMKLSATNISNAEVLDLTNIDDECVFSFIEDKDVTISHVTLDLTTSLPYNKPIGYVQRNLNESIIDQNYRLDEKKRYKEILAKFTGSSAFSSYQPEVITIPEDNNSLLKRNSLIDLTSSRFEDNKPSLSKQKSLIDLTNTAVNATVPPKPRRKFFNEILEDSRVSRSLTDISSPVESKPTKYSASNLLDLGWIQKWRNTLDPIALERKRQIKEAERKVAAFEKRKQEEYKKLQELRKKQSVLPELTDDMLKRVKSILGGGNPREIISQAFTIEVTRSDLQTLIDTRWLNDEVVNFYFSLLKDRSEKNADLPKIHVFNTFFYPKLLKNGFAGVKRWTRKVDIFSFDMILMPIHLGLHWCMAEINFKTKQIVYYDSLRGNNMNCVIKLKEYLANESMDKKKIAFDDAGWTETMPKDIPEQMNGCDCGVFASMYAQFRSRDASFTFSQDNMPYFRKRMVYEIASKHLL